MCIRDSVLARQPVAQPPVGRPQHLDVLRLETHFLLQLAEQRVLDLLAAVDAALGKLPAAPADASAEEQIAGSTRQNDAHVGAKAVLVDVVDGWLNGHRGNCSKMCIRDRYPGPGSRSWNEYAPTEFVVVL